MASTPYFATMTRLNYTWQLSRRNLRTVLILISREELSASGCADKDLAWIFDRLAGFNAKEGGDACHVQVGDRFGLLAIEAS